MKLTQTDSYSPPCHPLNYPIHPEWQPLFQELKQQQWFMLLLQSIQESYETLPAVAPQASLLWQAFVTTPLQTLKGVVLGQDPYPNAKHANGLAFSVSPGITIPASLRSIFFELERTHHIPVSTHGDLTSWAKQGVLLLNQTLVLDLTTKKPPTLILPEQWHRLNHSIIEYIIHSKSAIFMLAMGKKAQKATDPFLRSPNIRFIKTPHPSPLAAIGLNAQPFIGCNCFILIDQFLQENQLPAINWQLSAPVLHKESHPHGS